MVLDLQPALVLSARYEHVAGVINALLENALQHGAGRVTLTSRGAGEITIGVSDQGTGVPADLAGRVFERRFSASHGTGIGLALARSLASAENGHLELVGGEGHTWQLILPVADPRQPMRATSRRGGVGRTSRSG